MGSPALYPYVDSPHKWLLLFWRCVLHVYHGVESILSQAIHLTCHVIFSFASTWSINIIGFHWFSFWPVPSLPWFVPILSRATFPLSNLQREIPCSFICSMVCINMSNRNKRANGRALLNLLWSRCYRFGLEPGAHTSSLQQHSYGRMDCVLN